MRLRRRRVREGDNGPTAERRTAERFDKVIPVFLSGEGGVTSGVARNISAGGMFIELREPYPLRSRVKITFTAPGSGEITMAAEVRYQCFINYCGPDGTRQGLRGMGVRFLGVLEDADERKPGVTPRHTLH